MAVAVVALGGVIAYFALERTPSQLPGGETPTASEGTTTDPAKQTATMEETASEPAISENAASEPSVPDESPSVPVEAEAPAPEQAALTEPGPETVEEPAVEGNETATAETAEAVETAPEDESETPDAEAVQAVELPRFGDVRLEAGGLAVVAGTAPAEHEVRIEEEGAVLASARANSAGDFAAIFDLEPTGAARVLYLVAIAEDGTEYRSDENVILTPPMAPPEPKAPLVADAGQDSEAPAADDSPEPEGETVDEPDADGPQTAEVAEAGSVALEETPDPMEQVEASAVAPDVEEAPSDTGADQTAMVTDATPAKPEVVAVDVASVPENEAEGQAPATQVVSSESEDVTPAPVVSERAETAPETAVAAETTAAAASSAPDQPVPAAAETASAGAPTVLLSGRDGVELLQPAGGKGDLRDQVVVDVISYSDDGSVLLSGRAATGTTSGASVRIYLDNKLLESAEVEPDGSWRMQLPSVAPGIYTLRADQLDAAGQVVARFETPFKREDPGELAEVAPVAQEPGRVAASVITVQPGYTLWGIATDRYGSGYDYVQIFEANRSQIRDPDLIYPGQVFDLPDAPETATE